MQQKQQNDSLKCRMDLLNLDLEKVKNSRESILEEIENNETDLKKSNWRDHDFEADDHYSERYTNSLMHLFDICKTHILVTIKIMPLNPLIDKH